MATENIRDMNNWTYLMENSSYLKWVNKVCPHCINKKDCGKSDYDCLNMGGFMCKLGASNFENVEYIRKNIDSDIKVTIGNKK